MNIKNKWKELNEKYPWIKPVLACSIIAATGGAMYFISKKIDDSNIVYENSDDSNNSFAGMVSSHPIKNDEMDPDDKVYFSPAEAEATGSLKELWDREYKDNWDEVVECSKRLNLKRGEIFMIEDPSTIFDVEPGSAPIISHLVDNCGVYPPKE